MVKLGDITSIYEVAFATNFILGYLILNYKDIYYQSIKTILTQSYGEEFTENDNSFILKNGNKFSKKHFNNIKILFIISTILSMLSVLISFLFLLFSGLYPGYEINSLIYILSSTIFIIINPIIYFFYKINVINFNHIINDELITDNKISDFMKSYTPIPIYKESIFQKLKWFFYFKTRYVKSLFSRKQD